MYAGIETAEMMTPIAALIAWGLSFVGINKYVRSHSTQTDNGFYTLFSIFVSIAVAIAVAASSKLLIVQTAPNDMSLATTSTIMLAIAAVVIWGISFIGISRYMKSHFAQRDNGFHMLVSTAVSLGATIVAVAAARLIMTTQTAPAELGSGVTAVDIGLFAIILVVLIAPFKVKIVEKNLEAFLFIMGALAVTITSKWAIELVKLAAEEPVLKGIVPAVLVAGLVFYYGKSAFQSLMNGIVNKVPLPVLIFGTTFILGLICSVITAIISALFLCEIANLMPLNRKDKINFVVISCFAIGLGAVLTPLGEPLSTIAITKLQGPPLYPGGPGNAGFFYLADQLGVLIVLGVIACSIFAMFYVGKKAEKVEVTQMGEEAGGLREVFVRAGKVWLFVSALFLLGAGMEVLIFKYLVQVPDYILFWVNMVSAILDNATLTAAEISPYMSQKQINAALYGLLISGGMLIPGNIPNIISAGKLGITSSEWAKLGVPVGLALNAVYFVVVFVLGINPTLGL